MDSYAAPPQKKITDLPVELLAEIYLAALSPEFPQICKHIYNSIKSFPPSIHAQYLLSRHPQRTSAQSTVEQSHLSVSQLNPILRYPICTLSVIRALCRISLGSANMSGHRTPGTSVIRRLSELPCRLFRHLGDGSDQAFGPDSDPLPFLRFLWDKQTSTCFQIPSPDPNSKKGFPLLCAVRARFVPLIQFLLDHGADPRIRECKAVQLAIIRRDLELVKMLIECPPEAGGAKRRKRIDRVAVEPFMLNLAVRYDARDIVQYFIQEKGCVPDINTLKAL